MSDIRAIRYADVLSAPNAPELIAAYAAECSLPQLGPACPQAAIYEAMEASGRMQCFGAYERRGHPADEPELVGFAVVLTSVLPHYGQVVATVESLYCTPSGNGIGLMLRVEKFAAAAGCVAILYSAPFAGRLEHLLQTRRLARTNTVFCKRLA